MAKYELTLTSGNVFSTPVTLTVTPAEGPSVTISGSNAISTPVELAVLNSIGPRGETGPQGPQGPQGIQGSPGDSVNVQIFDGNIAVGQSVLTTDDVTFNSVTTTGDVTVNGTLTATVNGPFVGDVTVESGDTLTIDAGGGLSIPDDIISGDKVEDGTINAITINTLTSTSISGDLTGDVTGDVTGNLTGNVTGNVTGDVTGDVTGNLTGDVTGNVTGDLTGNADTADALTFIVRNSTGATLTKGTVVYVSGIQGNTPEVSAAQADSSATMPAFGLVQSDIATATEGVVTTFGSLLGLSVANFGETGVTFSLGDTVYVSATEAGKLTNVAPAGESSLIQNIGKIERGSPTTNMTIKVGGAGRTNATPNLDDGNIFIGNASNQSVTSDLNSEVRSRVSATGDLGYNQNTGVFSFTERTDDEVRELVSASQAGGDGSFSYDSASGVFTYTGPSASEVRDHFSNGNGVTITDGEVAIGQPVATTDDVTFDDLTLTGQLKGPATFTIDPAAHGDDTGTVVVAGNLQVDGTTTTINSTIVEIDDLNLKLAAEATTNAQANGAGITVGDGLANITYNSGTDRWVLDKELSADVVGTVSGDVTGNVTGNLTGNVTGTVSTLTNHDTDDLAEGTNKYYTDERVDDRVANLVVDGTGLTKTYDDIANTLTLNHSNSVIGDTVSEGGVARQLGYGEAFNIPSVTYDNQGHITGTTTTEITLPASDNTDTTYTDGDGLTLTDTEFDIDLTDTVIFTSTNTASRAVVRDANGDFAANIITTDEDAVINGVDVGTGPGTAGGNTRVGYDALSSLTTGNSNTALGTRSGESTTYYHSNTYVGAYAGLNAEGDDNTAVGRSALYSHINLASNNSWNTAIGAYSLYSITTGDNNTAVGRSAGQTLTTGSDNIMIGSQAYPSSATASHEITLGNGEDKSFRIPGSSFYINGGLQGTTGTKVGINTSNPAAQLHVSGDTQVDGTITVSGTVDGRDVSTDGTKLDGIETGATADQTGAEIKSLYEAEANAFTDAQFTKLAGIETGATADQTGAEIKAAYEAEANTNAYTDAEKTKLAGVESGATADQTGAEIKALYEVEANAFTDAQFTKLAGIETGATADQTGSEIKTALFAEADTNNLTDTLLTKLNGIEANADVTDTANVTAAGALMDSEVTNLAQVKAFNSADYATAAQGALADTAVQPSDDRFNIRILAAEETVPSGYIDTGGVLTDSASVTYRVISKNLPSSIINSGTEGGLISFHAVGDL